MFTAILNVENVLFQSRRFRGKVNIQRPRAPHYERALFNAVTQPVFQKRIAVDLCHEKLEQKRIRDERTKLDKPLHPYEKILSKELFECFDSAKMILICQRNSMSQYDFFKFRVACHQQNVTCKVFGRKIIEHAIKNTKFEPMTPILTQTPYNCMLFGSEWNVREILAILKKTPKMILLAGALGDRYMSRNELENYAKLPNISMVQAQLAATLNSVGNQLTRDLQAHQSNLCYMLDAHADILKSNSKVDEKPNEKSE